MQRILDIILGILLGFVVLLSYQNFDNTAHYGIIEEDIITQSGSIIRKGAGVKFNPSESSGFIEAQFHFKVLPENNVISATKKLESRMHRYKAHPIPNNSHCKIVNIGSSHQFSFPGGNMKLFSFNRNNIWRYIETSGEETLTEFNYTLTLSTSGNVVDADIELELSDSTRNKLERELLKMPDWIPSSSIRDNGECYKLTIPINVHLE